MISDTQVKQAGKPLVVIVVPNRNGAAFLKRNMPSLAATDYPNWIAVMADNASTDESLDLIRRDFGFCRLIAGDRDLGFAGNVNRGLRWGLDVRAKYIAVISNDVKVPPGWLSCAVEVLEENPLVGVLGFREVSQENELFIPEQLTVEQTVYPSGWAFVLRSQTVRKVGLYDETLYMYGEEQDYYPRVLRAGFVLAKTNVAVLHERHGLRKVSGKGLWFRYRNAIYCALKNFGIATGIIVAAKIFCYAALPEKLLQQMRTSQLSKLARQATLSEGSETAVDTSIALRSGRWMLRLGIFVAAVAWNILHLPSTLMRRNFPLGLPDK